MKVEMRVYSPPEPKVELVKGTENPCIIPVSEMDPLRDRNTFKIIEDTKLERVYVEGAYMWVRKDGSFSWITENSVDKLLLKAGGDTVGKRILNRHFEPLKLYVFDDPKNPVGKIWVAKISIKEL